MTDRSQYLAQRQAARVAHTQAHGLPAHVQHGEAAYNNWGCRCPVCREAHNQAQQAYRAAKRTYLNRHINEILKRAT